MTIAARLVSFLFHPLLMVSYLLCLLAIIFPTGLYPVPAESTVSLVTLFFLMTFLLPVLTMVFFRIFGVIRSFMLEYRSDRLLPFVFMSIFYSIVTYLAYTRMNLAFGDDLMRLLLVSTILVITGTAITFFYKISVHSLGIWGATGILLSMLVRYDSAQIFYGFLGAIVVAGLVMSARLQLGVHSFREVILGATIGLVVGYAAMGIL